MHNYSDERQDHLFPYSAAQAYLGSRGIVLAEQTLRRKVSEGVLPCIRLGGRTYLQKRVLDEWIERSYVPASRGLLISGGHADEQ